MKKKRSEGRKRGRDRKCECPIIVLVTIEPSCLRATFMWIRWENRKVKIPSSARLFHRVWRVMRMPPCTRGGEYLHYRTGGNDRKFFKPWKIQPSSTNSRYLSCSIFPPFASELVQQTFILVCCTSDIESSIISVIFPTLKKTGFRCWRKIETPSRRARKEFTISPKLSWFQFPTLSCNFIRDLANERTRASERIREVMQIVIRTYARAGNILHVNGRDGVQGRDRAKIGPWRARASSVLISRDGEAARQLCLHFHLRLRASYRESHFPRCIYLRRRYL